MKRNISGIVVCFIIAVVCRALGKQVPVIGGPVFAILTGMLLSLIWKDKTKIQPGIAFTSKKVLQYAVILLGFGLNLTEVAKVGAQSLPVILSTITTSLVIAFLLHKWLKIPSNISTLIGVGSSICGGSAIAATAPVIGADDEEIAQSISVIFLFNIMAALIFPSFGNAIGLSTEGFGLFAGTAINDTSSVTAAASAWDGMHPGANALDIATIVKLTRTLAIIPITLGLSLLRTSKSKESSFQLRNSFPFFVILFVVTSLITTIATKFGVAAGVFSPFKELSKFLIIMAMAAIGMNTNIVKLVKNGGKAILLGACCWSGITCVSLFMQKVMGIW